MESGQLGGILVSFIGKEFPITHLPVMLVLIANRKTFLTLNFLNVSLHRSSINLVTILNYFYILVSPAADKLVWRIHSSCDEYNIPWGLHFQQSQLLDANIDRKLPNQLSFL